MAMDTRARRRRLEGEEEEDRLDRISVLPDGVLGEIVSLLPTEDGARTQILSSRWRPIWRSAPLNLDFHGRSILQGIRAVEISRILSSHPGPGRRFSIPRRAVKDCSATLEATLDAWLRSPGLNSLQELEFYLGFKQPRPPRRFASTLRVASFGGCVFPDGDDASALHLPVLKQLSLLDVTISESSPHFLLAACPVLQSLMLTGISGCSRIRIMSRTVRSIAIRVQYRWERAVKVQQLIIQDAPCLERLLLLGQGQVYYAPLRTPPPSKQIATRAGTLRYGHLSNLGAKIVCFGATPLGR
ncbi:hypothetical protein SEVIR_2G015100v4 [Setaria viridis]|uniref:F-box/LRR-repeat protein 15/At3g58940/PEG3-like LRR domain-containing protein n=1 Tax=Setaria viridis TaxID=4556 RepID=A0A4V6DAN1_SETVI|nr:putative F-box/LRR-repeat protein At3g28410 [Setaria viridis]TKW30136.1 hypothetical protein SEVIR_2G015100v2 [Setaria viridis]